MLVIGHRGAAAVAPENTVAGVERAFADGSDAVEVDVRLSGDGRLVVVHDATVDRTTDGRGVVADMTATEIRSLDAGARFPGAAGRGLQVPLLEEVWEAAAGRVVLEIKGAWGTGEASRVAAALSSFLAGRDVSSAVASSFDLAALGVLRETGSPIATGVLSAAAFDAGSNIAAASAGGHAVSFLPDAVAGADAIRAARAAGIRAVVWTVNVPDRLRALRDAGADGIITDDPGAAIAAVRAR